MCGDNFSSEELKPVLQVIDLKLVQSKQHSATERYRVMLSDGSHYQQGMLATQMNELVSSGRLQKGSVVKLSQFICNVVQNRKYVVRAVRENLVFTLHILDFISLNRFHCLDCAKGLSMNGGIKKHRSPWIAMFCMLS